MASAENLDDVTTLCEIRLEHPQQVLREITDLVHQSADAADRLRERIERLADRISSRFASEEQSGRYEDVLCRTPWLTAQAQEIQQQHVRLLESLEGIRRLCETSDGPAVWWQQVRQEFEEFGELLREHEAAEKNLLSEMHPGPAWSQD